MEPKGKVADLECTECGREEKFLILDKQLQENTDDIKFVCLGCNKLSLVFKEWHEAS